MSIVAKQSVMRRAIASARKGIAAGQTPFGACIVEDENIVACGHNEVWAQTDSTAHAEIQVIRSACQKLGRIDLSGCVIYSTCEPCPMCFGACHWARLDGIVYGARIADARQAGFNELAVSNVTLRDLGKSSVELVGEVLRAECVELFDQWAQRENNKAY